MQWKCFTLHTTEEAEDLVSGMLFDLGFYGIEIKDLKPVAPEESGGLFGDVVPEMPEDDHKAEILFYADADADEEDVRQRVREGLRELMDLVNVGEGTIESFVTKEEDWINNWKAHFHSCHVDDILIRPTWEETGADDAEASMVLRIDPGTAFGTGAHESTQLAIRALRKYVKAGDHFLDIGTGSGILGIVALKSGAAEVFGTDLDPNTLPAIEDNLAQNGIDGDVFTRVLGNIADDRSVQDAAGYACYDVAAANIIAEILAEITPQVPKHLKKGGIYITSGILTEKEEIVLEAARRAGMQPMETLRMGEWSSIVFTL